MALDEKMKDGICGVWVDEEGAVHLSVVEGKKGRAEKVVEGFSGFVWAEGGGAGEGVVVEELGGKGSFSRVVRGGGLAEWVVEAKKGGVGVDFVRPVESQFLLEGKVRMFEGVGFSEMRRCQLDIETGSEAGEFSDATKAGDRVLAIGLRFSGGRERILVLGENSDAGERRLLEELNAVLAEEDPDTIEGHNIFKFDLDFLRVRAKRLKVKCAWGRFGQVASFRRSRLKVAERLIDFPRCDLAGRTVVDTYLLLQLYDITAREMNGYGLKEAAVYFGVTKEEDERTYIEGARIAEAFEKDREKFLAYLSDDLRETEGVADVLLPTYFEQAKSFPMLFQEVLLRGTVAKVDLLFLEGYYHARMALPAAGGGAGEVFEGGFTKSFRDGVYKWVLHFDVASLYPSLLLEMGRNPSGDELGLFLKLLREFRDYRLKYKQLARTEKDAGLRAEYGARQASFKILINSFYGYLGFGGARFGDSALAAEVTRRGRELLQALAEELEKKGCVLLEADTDGIYVSSEEFFEKPEVLLKEVSVVLPEGIELEHDGSYERMFCYKAKNYALWDGKRVRLRGSALRSRGMEPFLKRLTDRLVNFMVGAAEESPVELAKRLAVEIGEGRIGVEELAKSEVLGLSPEAYGAFVAGGGKPRRAAGEVSLLMSPRPRMGERVSYYLLPKEKGRTSDWQRARPVEQFDAVEAPYDREHYVGRIREWLERYEGFLGKVELPSGKREGELF